MGTKRSICREFSSVHHSLEAFLRRVGQVRAALARREDRIRANAARADADNGAKPFATEVAKIFRAPTRRSPKACGFALRCRHRLSADPRLATCDAKRLEVETTLRGLVLEGDRLAEIFHGGLWRTGGERRQLRAALRELPRLRRRAAWLGMAEVAWLAAQPAL